MLARFLHLAWRAMTTLLAGTALSLVAAPAVACSWADIVIESSYPTSGALNVPTNAVLFVYGEQLRDADDVQLVDVKGQTVAVEVRPAVPSGLDVVPLANLEPNREYELRAVGSSQMTSAVKFTTGAGPASVPEQLSAPELQVAVLSSSQSSCGEVHGLCIDASSQPNTTLEVRIGEEVLGAGAGAVWPMHRIQGGRLFLEEDCVEVRRRDMLGNRSEPTTACGKAIRRFELQDLSKYNCDDYLNFLKAPAAEVVVDMPVDTASADPVAADVDDAPLEGKRPASNGCALMGQSPDRSSLAWLGLSFVVLLARRGRRR